MDEQSDVPDPPERELRQAQGVGGQSQADPAGAERVQLVLDLPTGEYVRLPAVTVSREDRQEQATTMGAFLVHPSGDIETLSGSLQSELLTESRQGALTRLRAAWSSHAVSLPALLFALSLLVYLATRLISLADFPIYFFTDEAAQTVLAADLVRDSLHGWEGDFLPTYFKNGSYYNLSASVYLQVLPYLIFGKSVFVTRAVSVFVSLLAAVSVGFILKDFLKIPYWWSGTLLLSISPAWFLHSRTAFETVVFVSFYAGMLYAYLLYRLRSPRYLHLALLLAALAFYSYSPGQVIVAATGLLLLLSDARYHWQNRRVLLKGALLGLLLALPYLRFRLEYPTAAFVHLRLLNSYWAQPLPLGEKLSRFFATYLDGLSPGYWYLYHLRDLPRHVMKGYGHLLRPSLPFALLGLAIAVSRLRRAEYRVVLVALLAAPVGSALVGVGITRLLVLVIPAALLTALGVSAVLIFLENPAQALQSLRLSSLPTWLEYWKLPQYILSIGLFAVLTAVNIAILRDSLINGPTWYQDYSMGGMQYGASQVFNAAQEYLEQQPDAQIILSPTWANGTDVLARFFLGDPLPLQLGSVQGHIDRPLPLDKHTLFIATPQEYQQVMDNDKFANPQVVQTLPYPNDKPGFYFLRLSYSDDACSIFAAEREQRSQLERAEVQLDRQPVKVRHSVLDMGEIYQVFDGDPFTFVRSLEANPLVIELYYARARPVRGLSFIIGSAQVEITVRVQESPGGLSTTYSVQGQGSVEAPEMYLDFGQLVQVHKMRIEVLDSRQAEPAHIHVWEIAFDGE
jgi:4-amino-4-deoxy-L-arabinose transferase-like glycosyltransferase